MPEVDIPFSGEDDVVEIDTDTGLVGGWTVMEELGEDERSGEVDEERVDAKTEVVDGRLVVAGEVTGAPPVPVVGTK